MTDNEWKHSIIDADSVMVALSCNIRKGVIEQTRFDSLPVSASPPSLFRKESVTWWAILLREQTDEQNK